MPEFIFVHVNQRIFFSLRNQLNVFAFVLIEPVTGMRKYIKLSMLFTIDYSKHFKTPWKFCFISLPGMKYERAWMTSYALSSIIFFNI